MELKVDNIGNIQKEKKYKFLFIIAAAFVVILGIFLAYWTAKLFETGIYSNISVSGVNIGGMNKEDAIKKLQDYYLKANNQIINLKVNQKEQKVSFKELGVTYQINEAVDKAYSLGRSGGIIKNIIDIFNIGFNGSKIDIGVKYNKSKMDDLVNNLEKNILIKPTDDSYEIKNDELIFNFGSSGKGIDRRYCSNQIEQLLKKGVGGELELKVTEIEPKRLSADSIPTNPKDAQYIIENKKNIKYIPETMGVSFDKKQFDKLLICNSSSKQSFQIPVKLTKPKIMVKDLQSKMLKDTLSSYETYYGNSDQSRKNNIKLAASIIGETILGPGDEFSYNTIVGPRTADRGFQKAHVYSNGGVIDDYGGGICQTSSTLYNAVIKANLQIVERRNHMFTVGYAPLGLDATVSYGSIDFKFKNNKDWPIKIVNSTDGNNVKFSILGTSTGSNETIEYKSNIVKKIPFDVEKIEDSSMSTGKTLIVQEGKSGCVVETYKITKVNNQIISQEFMYRDTYRPLAQQIKIGTKIVANPSNANNLPIENNTNNNSNINQNNEISPTAPAVQQDNGGESVSE